MSTLLSRLKQLTSKGIALQEGKENIKVKTLLDTPLTLADYGFLTDPKTNEEYVAIVVHEYPNNFFYGGSVVTDTFKKLGDEFTEEELVQVIEEGVTFTLRGKTSSNNRDYIVIEFM